MHFLAKSSLLIDAQFAIAFYFFDKCAIFCNRSSKLEENQPVKISCISKLYLKRETASLSFALMTIVSLTRRFLSP